MINQCNRAGVTEHARSNPAPASQHASTQNDALESFGTSTTLPKMSGPSRTSLTITKMLWVWLS